MPTKSKRSVKEASKPLAKNIYDESDKIFLPSQYWREKRQGIERYKGILPNFEFPEKGGEIHIKFLQHR